MPDKPITLGDYPAFQAYSPKELKVVTAVNNLLDKADEQVKAAFISELKLLLKALRKATVVHSQLSIKDLIIRAQNIIETVKQAAESNKKIIEGYLSVNPQQWLDEQLASKVNMLSDPALLVNVVNSQLPSTGWERLDIETKSLRDDANRKLEAFTSQLLAIRTPFTGAQIERSVEKMRDNLLHALPTSADVEALRTLANPEALEELLLLFLHAAVFGVTDQVAMPLLEAELNGEKAEDVDLLALLVAAIP